MPAIAPLIPIAAQLLIDLIRLAQKAKELNDEKIDEIKQQLDLEFMKLPDWKDL